MPNFEVSNFIRMNVWGNIIVDRHPPRTPFANISILDLEESGMNTKLSNLTYHRINYSTNK